MNIKPIETLYKGYRFRSRLEARWAVFFDALGIEYQYEPEGYNLGELGWYLPDFLITTLKEGLKFFVEVKGNFADEAGIKKARFLDGNCSDDFEGCMIFSKLEYAEVNYYEIENRIDSKDVVYQVPNFNKAAIKAQILGCSFKDFNKAISKARQARF